MKVIFLESLNIKEIFQGTILEMTKRIAGIELESIQSVELDESNVSKIIILTNGNYRFASICYLEDSFVSGLISHMGNNIVPDEERELYAKEYINVVFGRVISKVNNLIGSRTRFTVPYVYDDVCEQEDLKYSNYEELYFRSAKGIIKFVLAYD